LDFVRTSGNIPIEVMVDGVRNRSARAPSRAVVFVFAAIGLHSLTDCSGKSEEEDASNGGGTSGTSSSGAPSGGVSSGGTAGVPAGGVSSGGVSSGGVSSGGVNTGGFAGHTSQCIGNPCAPGCGTCGGAGQGGSSTGGNAGLSGQGGSSTGGNAGLSGQGGSPAGGNAGFSGSFAGHTGQCISNPCAPGCGFCGGAGQGGASVGGSAGFSGGGAGFAGHTGSGFARLPIEESSASVASSSVGRGCYPVGGFEGDPCLPADDAVLDWLDARSVDCEPRVAAGPFDDYDGNVRRCCYSLSCKTGGTGLSSALPRGLH
jgi:hypothetical protein